MTDKKVLPDNVVLVNFNRKKPDRPDTYPKKPDINAKLNQAKSAFAETLPPDVQAELKRYQRLLSADAEDEPGPSDT